MITDHELDATLRRFFGEEAARVEQRAPSIEHAVALLLPRVERHAGPRRRLLLVLAAALLLIGAMASAIAIGQRLQITVDDRPPRILVEEFQPIGMLPQGAGPQALVAQPDGSALVVGGQALFRFDPDTGRFAEVGSLQTARTLPATVVLADGRVLIVGGGLDLSSVAAPDGYRAEIYDPVSGTSSLTGPTVHPRAWGMATLLQDGRVLVTGGAARGFAVATAEIFDPQTGEFVETGSMSRPRSYHSAVLLRDGRVLIVGGAGSDEPPSAEVYDPAAGTFVPAGSMAIPQSTGFSTTQLADGSVLFVGGWDQLGNLTAAAQLFDPDTGQFEPTGSLPAPRHAHASALLDDGRVLIMGGWGDDAIGEGDDAFIYDPATTEFTSTDSLSVQRLGPFVVTLDDGRVLVVGSQCWNQGCYGLDAVPSAADRDISAEVFE